MRWTRSTCFAVVVLSTAGLAVACGSFATTQNDAPVPGGDGSVDGPTSNEDGPTTGDGGGDGGAPEVDSGCAVMLDEHFESGFGPILGKPNANGDGGDIGVDSGVLVATVGVPTSNQGEAQVYADFPLTGDSQLDLTVVVTDVQPAPPGWTNAVLGCALQFDQGGDDVEVRIRSQNGELKFDATRKNTNEQTFPIGEVPATKTAMTFRIVISYVGGTVTGRVAVDGGALSMATVSHVAGVDKTLRLKCGLDFAQTSGVVTVPYVSSIEEVRLVRCP